MHVHLRRAGAAALLLAGSAIFSSACVKNESTLFITGCLEVPHDTCQVTASATAPMIKNGLVDGAFAPQYVCSAMFENQLVQRGNPQTLRTETSYIEVYQAEVQVLNDDPNTPTAFTKFTVPVSGDAPPATGTVPGIGFTNVVMIDADTLQTLAKKAAAENRNQIVVASVVLRARTRGGLEITSGEFKFPIEVCNGCSCAVPADDRCYSPDTAPAADCAPGQDQDFDCRLANVCSLVCAPSVVNPSLIDLTTATCPGRAPSANYVPCCG